MSSVEHNQMVEKIVHGLEIAEREMLEEKARNNEDVIVCGDDNVIRHIPAKHFLGNATSLIENRNGHSFWTEISIASGQKLL